MRHCSLVQTSCESCVYFDFIHSSVLMICRFMIQSCPTLICVVIKYFFHEVYYHRHIITMHECIKYKDALLYIFVYKKLCTISTTVASYVYQLTTYSLSHMERSGNYYLRNKWPPETTVFVDSSIACFNPHVRSTIWLKTSRSILCQL